MRLVRTIACATLVCPAVVLAQSTTLPRLVPAFTTHQIDASPVNRLTPIAVGPQGNLLFVTNTSPTDRLLMLDSTGKPIARFGRTGGGPGEVTNPQPIAITNNAIRVWDMGNQRLSEWTFGGKLIRENLLGNDANVFDVIGTEALVSRYGPAGFKPFMVNPVTGMARELLAANDSFYKARFDTTLAPRQGFAPITGTWDGGFLVGDAARYRVGLYTWQGTLVRALARDLPPIHASLARTDDFIAEMVRRSGRGGGGGAVPAAMMTKMREQAAQAEMPQITPGSPPRADAQKRIWIIGMEGDSAFADLFTSTRFIGRLHLPCRFFNGFWSVSGTWLALACVPDDPDAALDAVVKLFRIVETR